MSSSVLSSAGFSILMSKTPETKTQVKREFARGLAFKALEQTNIFAESLIMRDEEQQEDQE